MARKSTRPLFFSFGSAGKNATTMKNARIPMGRFT